MQTHCYECHKFDVAKGGIKILHHRLLVTVRKVVVPGQPEDSELFELISSAEAMCTTDEEKCSMRDEFQLRSMAQTRSGAQTTTGIPWPKM